jgi:hypothetical protein
LKIELSVDAAKSRFAAPHDHAARDAR